ncbi:MAG: hypothetical protein ABI540_07295 [Spartobacteria bacterium]
MFLLLPVLMVGVSLARAQDQENKLVDRLLRPDTTLANSAQNKTFTGTGTTAVDKKFVAKSFYAGDEQTAKSFSGGKDFSAKKFEAQKFNRAERAADTKPSFRVAQSGAEFPTQQSALIRTASDEGKVSQTKDYPDNRPFLGQGTRQKILSQENKPLTIDEVRELLNKSK